MGINIFPYTFWCNKICRENIFCRLDEAHSSERKLVKVQNYLFWYWENYLIYRKNNIFRKYSRNVNILHGLWTKLRSSPKAQPTKREEIPHKLAKTTITRNHTWWYLIIEDWVRAWRKYAADMECKSTLKEAIHSKTSWWPQKDKDLIMKKSGVIYWYKCNRLDCDEEYIGESSRVFVERFKEHQKAPSPIFDHTNTTGHNIYFENFSIVGREDQNLKRAIKEALFTRVNNPSLNRNIGKFHLPYIWDEVLYNTSELKLK